MCAISSSKASSYLGSIAEICKRISETLNGTFLVAQRVLCAQIAIPISVKKDTYETATVFPLISHRLVLQSNLTTYSFHISSNQFLQRLANSKSIYTLCIFSIEVLSTMAGNAEKWGHTGQGQSILKKKLTKKSRCLAAASPSPPLLPGPQTISTLEGSPPPPCTE